MVTPIKNFTCVQVNEGTNDIASGPPFSEVRAISVPFEHSVAIVSIRIRSVSNSFSAREHCIFAAPADLHETIGEQGHLVIEAILEDGSIRSDRNES